MQGSRRNKQVTPSFNPPQEVIQACKILLDNPAFDVVMSYRMRQMVQETMQYSVEDEILAAHRDYKCIEDLQAWIEYVSEQ